MKFGIKYKNRVTLSTENCRSAYVVVHSFHTANQRNPVTDGHIWRDSHSVRFVFEHRWYSDSIWFCMFNCWKNSTNLIKSECNYNEMWRQIRCLQITKRFAKRGVSKIRISMHVYLFWSEFFEVFAWNQIVILMIVDWFWNLKWFLVQRNISNSKVNTKKKCFFIKNESI